MKRGPSQVPLYKERDISKRLMLEKLFFDEIGELPLFPPKFVCLW